MTARGQVSTVLGPLGADSLGRVLMHEHTTIRWAGAENDYRPLPLTGAADPEVELATVVAQLRKAKDAGISTIVDAAPADLGRNAEFDRRAATEADINIVAVTGQYSFYRMPWYDRRVNAYWQTQADDLAWNFVREIEEGIGDTGIKAGLLKVATDIEVDDYSERALRAVARAHVQTGVGIITHTEAGTRGPEQCAIFAEEGADLSRVVIGHNDTGDLTYLLQILDTGAVLGYDRFGYEMYLPERIRFEALAALLRLGYEDQLVASHDLVTAYSPPQVDLDYVPNVIAPKLLEAGISEAAIEKLFVTNPKRILAGVTDAGAAGATKQAVAAGPA
jgi:phosphotriesterase-related protein